MANIEMPKILLNKSFYICFYGYLSVGLATELQNATGNSYILDKLSGTLYTAGVTPIQNNQTIPVNWIIGAAGQ
jgi:hypothetical protein